MKWTTVLFDFDGTVFDTVEGITKSVQYALRKHGMEAPLESLRCFAGPPLVDKFMEVFGVDQTEAEQLVTDFRERYRPTGVYESSPFPGIRDLLQHLKNSGLTLGIATSKPQPMAELLLDRSNLRELFHVVVGSTPGINNEKKCDIVKFADLKNPYLLDITYLKAPQIAVNPQSMGYGFGFVPIVIKTFTNDPKHIRS